ncbi:hypothetical protein [Micromonospora avicenniae]|uniref:hypothetical protein n=1 Tax=Micromonospora avicenniae TaxID=1198245 RepID=UPI003330F24A
MRTVARLVAVAVVGSLLPATPAHAEPYEPYDTRLVKTVINNGNPIAFGASGSITVPVTVQIAEDSGGLATVDAKLRSFGGLFFAFLDGPAGHNMTCAPVPATMFTCTGAATFGMGYVENTSAGRPVQLTLDGYAYDSGRYDLLSDPADNVLLLKKAGLVAPDAGSGAVRKGGSLTITGKLTYPDWNRLEAGGNSFYSLAYAGQPVSLEFKKAGTSSYTRVRTVTSAADGTVRTTVTADASGTWRWSFAGAGVVAASVSPDTSILVQDVRPGTRP